jgi:hypothetical protein
LIVSTLNKCKYHDGMISDQIKCDIINVLNEKLKLIVGGVEITHTSHANDKKQKQNFVSKFKNSKRSRVSIDDDNEDQRVSTSSSDEEIDTLYFSVRYDYSPTSSNESEMAMSWTSGLSPESSPRSHVYGNSSPSGSDGCEKPVDSRIGSHSSNCQNKSRSGVCQNPPFL